MDRILCAHYRLEQIEPFLEVPLDGIVGGALVKAACDCGQLRRLPRWRTIKGLTRKDSATYQAFASEFAEEKGLALVHLGVVLCAVCTDCCVVARQQPSSVGASGSASSRCRRFTFGPNFGTAARCGSAPTNGCGMLVRYGRIEYATNQQSGIIRQRATVSFDAV